MAAPEIDPEPRRRPEIPMEGLALLVQEAERSVRWRRWIMVAGTAANLAWPVITVIVGYSLGFGILGLVVGFAMPLLTGSSIAYFGLTLADSRVDPWQWPTEWAFKIPGKCLWFGMAPYLVFSFAMIDPLPVAFLATGAGWGLASLGGGITAFVIDRWFYKQD